jgi:hypothetical protein
LVNNIDHDSNSEKDSEQEDVMEDESEKPIFAQKHRPKLRVTDEGRVLIEGTNDNQLKSKIRKNFENWIVNAISPLPNGVNIKLLENGKIFVNAKNSLQKAELEEKIEDLLMSSKDIIENSDPTKRIPTTNQNSSVKITDDGKILILCAHNYSVKNKIEKQINDILCKSKISKNPRISYKIQPNGTILVLGALNSKERVREEKILKEWLWHHQHIFGNIDVERFPPVQQQLSVEITDNGSVDIKTNDLSVSRKVKDQIIYWILKSMPPLQGLKIDIDETGQIILTGIEDEELLEIIENFIKQLLLTNRELFENYNINKPLQPVASPIAVTVTEDWRIEIDAPIYFQPAVVKKIENWLLTGFPELADKLKLTILDDGSIKVAGDISETVRIKVIRRIKLILKDNKDELENFQLLVELPYLVGNAIIQVLNDGRILIDGPDYIKIELEKLIEEWLLTGFPNLDPGIKFKFSREGKIDVTGTTNEQLLAQLKQYINDIILSNAHILEEFDPLFGLPPIQTNIKISIADDGKILIESPAYLKDTVQHSIENWLLTIFPTLDKRISFKISDNGLIDIIGTNDDTLKNILLYLVKDFLSRNKNIFLDYNFSKGLPPIVWKVTIMEKFDGTLVFDGPASLVKKARQDLVDWIRKTFPTLDSKITITILENGSIEISGTTDEALKKRLKQLIVDFLQINKDLLKDYDIIKGFPIVSWNVTIIVQQDGSIKINGPSILIKQIREEVAKWILKSFQNLDPKISCIIREDGLIEIIGTDDDFVLKRTIEKLIKEFLLSNKDILLNFDIIKGLTLIEWKVIVKEAADGAITFEGPASLVEKAKQDFIQWVLRAFPTLDKNITFEITENGGIIVIGTTDILLKKRLEQLIKDFLLFVKENLKDYDIIKGFPIVSWNVTIIVQQDGSIKINGPSILIKQIREEVAKWILKIFSNLDPKISLIIREDGLIEIIGTDDDFVLKQTIEKLIKEFLLSNKDILLNFDLLKGLTVIEWKVIVKETADGAITFEGPASLVEKAKQDFIQWVLRYFPTLDKNITFEISENGGIIVIGTTDILLKKRLEQLIKDFLLFVKENLKDYDIIKGFPIVSWNVTIIVQQDGSIKINGPSILIKQIREEIAKWILKIFSNLDPKISLIIREDGLIEIIGTDDDSVLKQTIEKLIKEFLLSNKDILLNFDILKGLTLIEWKVIVKEAANGTITFVGPASLVEKAQQDFIQWVLRAFPTLDKNITFEISENGGIKVIGTTDILLKTRLEQLIKDYLLFVKENLKEYDIVKGFPTITWKLSITVRIDGTLKIDGPGPFVIRFREEFAQWLRSQFTTLSQTIMFTVLDSGEIAIDGTNDADLIYRLKQLIKDFLLDSNNIFLNFDFVKGFPIVDTHVTILIDNDGSIKFSGPTAIINKFKQDLIKWILAQFPTFDSRITLFINANGDFEVVGTQDVDLINRLKKLIKDFLLTNKNFFKDFDYLKAFPAIKWQTTITFELDGTLNFDGPAPLTDLVRQDLAKWIRFQFSTLDTKITFNILYNGEIEIVGTNDQKLIALIRQLIKDLLLFNKDILLKYDILNGFPRIDWSVSVTISVNGQIVITAPQPLKYRVKFLIEEWLNKLFVILKGNVTSQLQDDGSVIIGGTMNPKLIERIQKYLNAYLLAHTNIFASFDIFKPLPVEQFKATIELTEDGRILINAPDYWKAQAKLDIEEWLQQTCTYMDFNLKITIQVDGKIELSGTSDSALLISLKLKILAFLKTYKDALLNYDLITPLPKILVPLIITIDNNYGILFEGAGQAEAAEKIETWVLKCFPSLTGKFTVHIEKDGKIRVDTTLEDSIKIQLANRIKLLIREYKKELINSPTVPLPIVKWEVTVTLTKDDTLHIDGPEVLKGKIKQQIIYSLIKEILSLNGEIEIQIQDNGKVSIEGTDDEVLKASIRKEIRKILLNKKDLLINLYLA